MTINANVGNLTDYAALTRASNYFHSSMSSEFPWDLGGADCDYGTGD